MSAEAPRWEWRTFAPDLARVDMMMPAEFEPTDDIYVLSAGSNTSVKIRNRVIEVKTLDDIRDGLELWQPVFSAAFPLCQRDVRTVLRLFPAALPSTLFLPQYTVLDFVVDIVGGGNDLRLASVHTMRRHSIADGCAIERAAASVAGQTVQTAAIDGPDPAAVARLVHSLGFEERENVSYVTFLKRLPELRPSAERRSVSVA